MHAAAKQAAAAAAQNTLHTHTYTQADAEELKKSSAWKTVHLEPIISYNYFMEKFH